MFDTELRLWMANSACSVVADIVSIFSPCVVTACILACTFYVSTVICVCFRNNKAN